MIVDEALSQEDWDALFDAYRNGGIWRGRYVHDMETNFRPTVGLYARVEFIGDDDKIFTLEDAS